MAGAGTDRKVSGVFCADPNKTILTGVVYSGQQTRGFVAQKLAFGQEFMWDDSKDPIKDTMHAKTGI